MVKKEEARRLFSLLPLRGKVDASHLRGGRKGGRATPIRIRFRRGSDVKAKAATRISVAAIILAALLSFAPAYAAGGSVVGDWYGVGQPDDKDMAYLDHIKANGTYVSEFEVCKGKKTEHHIESGTWSSSPDITRVITTAIDGHGVSFQFDYAMVSNDGKTWSYSIAAAEPENPTVIGYRFTARRVSPDFRMPGCLQIS
jgi:hypothetical protein